MGDELFEGPEGVLDSLGELALGLAAAGGGEVGPENRVVGVPAEVEREVFGELVHLGKVARVARSF